MNGLSTCLVTSPFAQHETWRMQPQDPVMIRSFLASTTLKECLEWFKETQDKRISSALKSLLFDKDSGSVRTVSDRTLQGELLVLARKNDAFGRFVADKSMVAFDRITTQYLEEQSGL